MSFNIDRFNAAEWTPRKRGVSLPALEAFFEPGENGEVAAEWVVRGLTGNELAKTHKAAESRANAGAIIEALSAGTKSEKILEIQRSLGYTDDVEAEIAKRLEMLVLGSVDPVISLDVAVKLAKHRPVEFYHLTNTITELTGLGSDIKKKS